MQYRRPGFVMGLELVGNKSTVAPHNARYVDISALGGIVNLLDFVDAHIRNFLSKTGSGAGKVFCGPVVSHVTERPSDVE